MTRAPRIRRGFTLLDLLMTMFVFTTFMGLCVALVEMVLRLDSGGQEHLEAMETAARLARIFRADVHAATEASPAPGPDTPRHRLVLTLPEGQTVEYRVLKGDIVRAERQGGKLIRNDRFRIPARLSELSLEPGEGRTVAALVIDRRTIKKHGEPRTLRVEATLGSDHRHEREGLP
jgi:type II secretory pathway component PulJ